MIAISPTSPITFRWLEDRGVMLIQNSRLNYDSMRMLMFKQNLFSWHEPSIYGTTLDILTLPDGVSIAVPAAMMVDYLHNPSQAAHLDLEWPPVMETLQAIAGWITETIASRAFKPDQAAFADGRLEWVPTEQWHTAEFEWAARAMSFEIDYVGSWFSQVIKSSNLIDLQQYPMLQQPGVVTMKDEQDWLVSIGWTEDVLPFRICLQLVEPETEARSEAWSDPDQALNSWTLQIVLQDKSTPVSLFPCTVYHNDVTGIWPAEWTPSVKDRVLLYVQHWIELVPELDALPESALPRTSLVTALQDQQVWSFLSDYSIRLAEAGYTMLLPAWWEALSRTKPKLKAKLRKQAGGSQQSFVGMAQLIDFDWRVAIGDIELSEQEFQLLLAQNTRLVQFKGQWIVLDPTLMASIRQTMNKRGRNQGLTFQEVLEMHLLHNADIDENGDPAAGAADSIDPEVELELNEHMLQLLEQLQQHTNIPVLEPPAGLLTVLRPYQQSGYSWLVFMRQFGLGCCLADDMGLGKTVQYIAYLLRIRRSGNQQQPPSLLVCPTSVLGNWQKELQRFAPELRIHMHYGASRQKPETFAGHSMGYDLVLTTYALAAIDQEALESVTWNSLCLDEAQNIKNAYTKQSSALRQLTANHRIALTGTPIENRLSELWSIYDFINPGYLGSMRTFQNEYAAAIERRRETAPLHNLQKLVRPFLLRRKKTDKSIQLDLPEKNEMKVYVNLSVEQSALYETLVQDLLNKMQVTAGIERKGIILAALTRFKQLCDHPALLLKEDPQQWDVSGERSQKLERLLTMVRELREAGDKCLIFSQFTAMGSMLKTLLEREFAEPVLYLHGGVPKAGRDRMIEQFQNSPAVVLNDDRSNETVKAAPHIFVLSLKAGGTGLNLTAANHVFHYDRWWNPAVENQATDRAYRIGQFQEVQVHKFITLGTMEERIDEMIERKQQLGSDVISASEGWITELSEDDLKDLFMLRKQWNE